LEFLGGDSALSFGFVAGPAHTGGKPLQYVIVDLRANVLEETNVLYGKMEIRRDWTVYEEKVSGSELLKDIPDHHSLITGRRKVGIANNFSTLFNSHV
jgi:hypothetical protein